MFLCWRRHRAFEKQRGDDEEGEGQSDLGGDEDGARTGAGESAHRLVGREGARPKTIPVASAAKSAKRARGGRR